MLLQVAETLEDIRTLVDLVTTVLYPIKINLAVCVGYAISFKKSHAHCMQIHEDLTIRSSILKGFYRNEKIKII